MAGQLGGCLPTSLLKGYRVSEGGRGAGATSDQMNSPQLSMAPGNSSTKHHGLRGVGGEALEIRIFD